MIFYFDPNNRRKALRAKFAIRAKKDSTVPNDKGIFVNNAIIALKGKILIREFALPSVNKRGPAYPLYPLVVTWGWRMRAALRTLQKTKNTQCWRSI